MRAVHRCCSCRTNSNVNTMAVLQQRLGPTKHRHSDSMLISCLQIRAQLVQSRRRGVTHVAAELAPDLDLEKYSARENSTLQAAKSVCARSEGCRLQLYVLT